MLVDYTPTYPNTTIRYHESNIHLYIESNATYIVLPNACSRGDGHFYLSNHLHSFATFPNPPPNDPIITKCTTLRNVMTLDTEAETGTLHHNSITAIPIRVTLEELNHPQDTTFIKTDNDTTKGFLTFTIQKMRSKAWDTKYHWMKQKII